MRWMLRGACLALGFAGSAHATNGYFLHGYGTDSKAQAGVGIADPQDALTVAVNPAGLTELPSSLTLGIDIFRPDRHATFVQGGQAATYDGNDSKIFLLPELGYSSRLGSRAAVGIALYGNGGLNTDYDSNPYARFGATGSAGVDLQQAFLSPGLAVRVGESQSAGIALNLAYQRFKAKGVGLFAGFSSDPAAVSDRGYDSSSGVGVRLGWLAHLGSQVSVGATWQSKTKTGRFKKYAGLFADRGSFDIPETYGLGVSWTPSKAWRLGADWQRIRYSQIPSVGNSLALLFSGVPLGADGGPGFGWRDISVVKIGGSYVIDPHLTLRAGFSRSQQPVPASQTFFNVLAPGVIQTHLTIGASWKFDSGRALHLAFLHAPRKTVQGAGSIPPSFGGGEVNVDLKENSLAISFSQDFD